MNLKTLSYWAVLLAAVAVVLAAIPGCTTLEAPKTFNERLAYGYVSVAAARNTTVGLLERKRISKPEAAQIQELANQSRAALDLARATYSSGDISTAQGQLDLAISVLGRLEAYLQEKAK